MQTVIFDGSKHIKTNFLMDQPWSNLHFADETIWNLGFQHDLLGEEFPTEVLREWAISASESERLKRDMTQPSPWGWGV